jgi:hypothetical protein
MPTYRKLSQGEISAFEKEGRGCGQSLPSWVRGSQPADCAGKIAFWYDEGPSEVGRPVGHPLCMAHANSINANRI